MKQIIRNRFLSWSIRAVLIVLGVSLLCGFSFLLGEFHANKRARFKMASAACFYTVHALQAIQEPEERRFAVMLDTALDESVLRLMEICLKYPDEIEPTHYNDLVQVLNYREQYGRVPERANTNFKMVDNKVAEAIARLDSIHNTKDWVSNTIELNFGR